MEKIWCRIIIIVKLDILLEQCDIIGDPKPLPPIADGATLPTSKPSPASTIGHMTSSSPQYQSGNSYSGGLMPNEENMGMGSYKQAPGQGRSSGPPLYNSSLGSKAESGQYNQTSAFGYSNTESATGLSRSPPSNCHVRPIQPAYPSVPPMYGNRGPIAKNGAPPRIIPIAALNPYQGRWTIKARVTAKGDLRQYCNQRGEGKVFSFDLLDSDGGEIRATCFNAAADQFYHLIEDGKVYLISKGTLKPAQRNFNHLPNDHEIMLDSSSTVQPCFEGEHSIPQQSFQFRPINEIEGIENNTIIDVIGVLCSISPSTPIMRKNGTETLKRSLQIKDMSGRSVEVTLWGNFCNAEGQTLQNICDSGVYPVLAVKSAKVNDFSGNTVWTIPTSKVIIEPDIPEAHKLKAWMENDGKNAPVASLNKLHGDDSISVALKSGNSVLNTATSNAAYGGVGIKESAQHNVNYMGNISNAGQGTGFPASQVGQFGNQNVGPGLTSTGTTTVYMRCSTCGQLGHSSIKCPAAMDGQEHSFGGGISRTISAGSGSAGGGVECFKCHQHGHWASNCPNAGSALPGYGRGNISTSAGGGGSGGGECFKCHQHGHWASNCPNAGSALPGFGSGNISTSTGGGGECFKCHQNGHWAKDCPSAGVSTAGYGSGNVSAGRYGGTSNQYVGGY